MSSRLNKGCQDYQNERRQNTINIIQESINRLKEEGGIITLSKLVEHTGFARSTFSKEHAKTVLKKNKVCQYEDKVTIIQEEHSSKLIERISAELVKSNKNVARLTQELDKLKHKNIKLENNYNNLQSDYQLLLGNWHVIVKKATIAGVKITK